MPNLSCTLSTDKYYDSNNIECEPLCSKVITGLKPTKANQVINALE